MSIQFCKNKDSWQILSQVILLRAPKKFSYPEIQSIILALCKSQTYIITSQQ